MVTSCVAGPPRQMRAIMTAMVVAEKNRHSQHDAQHLRAVGCPGGASDSPPQVKNEQLVERGVGEGGHQGDEQRNARSADAVEESHQRPHRGAGGSSAHARIPERGRQLFDAGIKPEGREDQVPRRAHQHEQRRRARHRPQRGPQRLRRACVAARAEGVRHQCLHGVARAAQHQHHHDDQPLHRAHGGERARGNAPDEPHIGEAEHDLHGAVGHERQGEREHRALVHMRATVGAHALCRQIHGNILPWLL
jgi:hypothetical protein